MLRREFLLTLAAGLTMAVPALADYTDDVVRQLMAQGYQNITVTKTWLGRIRIIATREGGTREIVLNPRTGEILRDLWTGTDGTVRTVSIVDDVPKGGGSNSGGSGSGSDDGGSSGGGSDDGGGSGSGSGSDDGGSSGGGSGSGGGSDDGGSSGGGSGSGGGSDDGGSSGGGSDDGGGSGSGSGSDGGGSSGGGGSGSGSDDSGDLLDGIRDRKDDDRRDN